MLCTSRTIVSSQVCWQATLQSSSSMQLLCNPTLPSTSSPLFPFPCSSSTKLLLLLLTLHFTHQTHGTCQATVFNSMLARLLSDMLDDSSCRWPSPQLHLWQHLLTRSQRQEWNCWRDKQFLHKFKAASSTCTWPMNLTTSHKQWTYDISFWSRTVA